MARRAVNARGLLEPPPNSAGTMGAEVATFDWSNTALGPMETWPSSLRANLALMLACPTPMFLAWGPNLLCFYNDAYRPILGYRVNSALGRPFKQVWLSIWSEIEPLVIATLAGETRTMTDMALDLSRNGVREESWWTFTYSPAFDDDGNIAGLFCVTGETTARMAAGRERDAAYEQLRQSEAALLRLNETLEQQVEDRTAERDRMWDTSPDLMLVIDFEGFFRRVNPAWTAILGYAADELVGRHVSDFVLSDDHRETVAAYEDAAAGGRPRIENRYRHKDGTVRWISWTAAPAGDMTYATGRDITVEKDQQADLEIAQAQLRQSQKMEALGQLTGGVAHDFNNLLTPIIGSLDLLVRKGIGGNREQRLIDGALQSADRAKTLVQRLLAFARKQPLQPTAVDVESLIQGMAALLHSTLGPRIEIVVDLPVSLAAAHADANQLEMALLNLAVNAMDAMPEGGKLIIAARTESVLSGHPADIKSGDYIRISITDNGVGMDAETLRRATEPFFSTKGVGRGTGLGLSMAHGLAAQLGGGLFIKSSQGEGTTVDVWLRVSLTNFETENKNTALVGPSSDGSAGIVLLVDDEELVRMSTADMLEDLGYEVVEASSAEGAMKLLNEGVKPDMLVTDHLMPGMSGAELARHMKGDRPELPVLIVSGYADLDSLDADVARLTKPFRAADLQASLASLMHLQSSLK